MKKILKGFTLIELIVVMAIFGIIMAAAISLMPLVTKMMIQADVHESTSAGVTSLSNYLKGQLEGVEYIDIYNTPYAGYEADGTTYNINVSKVNDLVQEFAEGHYAGIIRNGETNDPSSCHWATGTIHVMIIDNAVATDANNVEHYGMIHGASYAYEFSATPHRTGSANPTSTADFDLAVNRAYYDATPMFVKFGDFRTESDFNNFNYGTFSGDTTATVGETTASMQRVITSENTLYTIMSEVTRSNQKYYYLTNKSMTLANIFNNNSKYGSSIPDKTYYTIANIVTDSTVDPPVTAPAIKEIKSSAVTYHYDEQAINFNRVGSDGNQQGYCIIYSYNAEIDNNQ